MSLLLLFQNNQAVRVLPKHAFAAGPRAHSFVAPQRVRDHAAARRARDFKAQGKPK